MKTIRFLCIFIVILAMVLIGSPVFAGPGTSTYTYTTVKNKGYEILPGWDCGGNKYGATFVTEVSGNNTKGTLSASVNYYGTGPHTPSTTIFGGNWALTVTTGEKKGMISGIITPTGSILQSKITWENYKNNPIGRGWAEINLSITGGTKDFANVTSGTGTFKGYDNHMSGIYIFDIQVPTVEGGTLTLKY
jgi:hypothetical protein